MSLQSLLRIPKKENFTYTYALAAGNIIAAESISKNTRDEERRKKIDRVLQLKDEALNELGKKKIGHIDAVDSEDIAARLLHWKEEWTHLLLVDLIFASPFAPYEIACDKKEQQSGLRPRLGIRRQHRKI